MMRNPLTRELVPERAVPAILVLAITLILARGAPAVFGQVGQTIFGIPVPTATPPSFLITRTLALGSTDALTGGEVSVWQDFLVKENKGPMALALKSAFGRGVAKGYFGGLTGKATEEWQAARGIIPTAPVVGPKTRAILAQLRDGGVPPAGRTVRITFLDRATGQPIGNRGVQFEQVILCVVAPCSRPTLSKRTDDKGVVEMDPSALRQYSEVFIDGFDRYTFPAPPAADETVRLNNLSANYVTVRSVEATYDRSVRIGETELVSWTLHFPGVANLASYYAVIGLLGGPTPGTIAVVPAVTGSARVDGVFSWQVRAVTQDDIMTLIKPGTYLVSVSIYDGLPCVQAFCTAERNGRLVASDETDATFTILPAQAASY